MSDFRYVDLLNLSGSYQKLKESISEADSDFVQNQKYRELRVLEDKYEHLLKNLIVDCVKQAF